MSALSDWTVLSSVCDFCACVRLAPTAVHFWQSRVRTLGRWRADISAARGEMKQPEKNSLLGWAESCDTLKLLFLPQANVTAVSWGIPALQTCNYPTNTAGWRHCVLRSQVGLKTKPKAVIFVTWDNQAPQVCSNRPSPAEGALLLEMKRVLFK